MAAREEKKCCVCSVKIMDFAAKAQPWSASETQCGDYFEKGWHRLSFPCPCRCASFDIKHNLDTNSHIALHLNGPLFTHCTAAARTVIWLRPWIHQHTIYLYNVSSLAKERQDAKQPHPSESFYVFQRRKMLIWRRTRSKQSSEEVKKPVIQ